MSLGHQGVELLPPGELWLEGAGPLAGQQTRLSPVTPVVRGGRGLEILLERVGGLLGQEKPDGKRKISNFSTAAASWPDLLRHCGAGDSPVTLQCPVTTDRERSQ